ncbi:MP gene product [Rattail cactus necrosis-associated virus]|uniref:Movement protein n=1 Tax=Rattail cactus necrosis-associated virus TaxID=1123754 RepID=G9CU45_9VIRU|nr:MP gene product [Rattail cactus necrosis-associated virus]AEV53622.1 movement protein [Rattail cactus necrosis-associated virus]
MSSLCVSDPAVLLSPELHLKVPQLKSLVQFWKKPFKTCSISMSDVIKVASSNPLSIAVDFSSAMPSGPRNFKYVYILAVVLTGRWHLSESCPGGATFVLYDKRLCGRAEGIYGSFFSKVSASKFQVRFSVGHSMTVNDLLRNPLHLCFSLESVPCQEGYEPLSVEVSSLQLFTDCILEESLSAKLVKYPALCTDNMSVISNVDDVIFKFNSVLNVDNVPNSVKNVVKCNKVFKGRRSRGKWVGSQNEVVVKDGTNVTPHRLIAKDALHQRTTERLRLPDQVMGRPPASDTVSERYADSGFPSTAVSHTTSERTVDDGGLRSDQIGPFPYRYVPY